MGLLKKISTTAIALGWASVMASSAVADSKYPVVVELYTSQGCSSCPPADAHLHELTKRDDVIALGLHVDYWDYIGWKDVFGNPAHTLRQHAYARAGKRRSVFTPQMIINGEESVVGARPKDVANLIRKHNAQSSKVTLNAQRNGGSIQISGKAQSKHPMVVHLVRYSPKETVKIRRGENAGKTISYANIVREWTTLGKWNGAGELSMSAKLKGDYPAVVIVQREGHGAIEAAVRVK